MSNDPNSKARKLSPEENALQQPMPQIPHNKAVESEDWLDKALKHLMVASIVQAEGADEDVTESSILHFTNYNLEFKEAKAAIQTHTASAVRAAQTNAVAWTIGIIDEMHEMDSPVRDSVYKGIKNGIRDTYQKDTGLADPAPNYPINVKLAATQPEASERG